MEYPSSLNFPKIPLTQLTLLTFLLLFPLQYDHTHGCYTSIFSFGDSLTDTGNLIHINPTDPSNHLPYGQTFFNHPTGRCSDGRLIIDFLAQAMGIPYIPPYLGDKTEDFGRHGVNFAVAGATALGVDYYAKRGVESGDYSLEIQLRWFKQILPSLCTSPLDCQNLLRGALFLVGEIGGNDYSTVEAKGAQEMQAIVPNVVDVISSTITALINEGAVTLMVPGVETFGCFPLFLTVSQSQNTYDYDPSTGCLKWLNKFSQYHNTYLQKELNRLREIHPHTTIVYVDLYNAMMDMFRFPEQLGYKGGALIACCGGGGPYNYNSSAKCGCPGSRAYENPSLYVSWDGSHLTERAHKWIATKILDGPFTNPQINISCTASKTGNVNQAYS